MAAMFESSGKRSSVASIPRPTPTQSIIAPYAQTTRPSSRPGSMRSVASTLEPGIFATPRPTRRKSSDCVSGSRMSGGSSVDDYAKLHRLIRTLASRLEAKTAECRHLLEREDGDVLREQVRRKGEECGVWRERALAAERRVEVLERFVEELRGYGGDNSSSGVRVFRGRLDGRSGGARTEDGGTVTARIRGCLHAPAPAPGGDGVEDGEREISRGTVELWMRAQGMLGD